MESTEILETATKLAGIMTQLTEVLEQESSGVYQRKNSELEALYKQKSALLADYSYAVSTLREHGDRDSLNLPAALNDELKQRSNKLTMALERNVKALNIAHEASQRVVEVIINTVRNMRSSGAAYTKDNQGGYIPNAGGEASAVTLDTRL